MKYLAELHRSALHHIDIFNRDRAAIAIIDHENSKPDCRFSRRNRQNQQRENLPDQRAAKRRESHKIDVYREQDQLDRHENDDHVFAVDENAEHAKREQDRRDRQIMSKTDHVRVKLPVRKALF